jgi:hypothetical protein
MQPTTEILDNVVAIAEIMLSRNLPVPDVPYLELAKWIRVIRNVPRLDPPLHDRSCTPAATTDPSGPGEGGQGKLIVLINSNHERAEDHGPKNGVRNTRAGLVYTGTHPTGAVPGAVAAVEGDHPRAGPVALRLVAGDYRSTEAPLRAPAPPPTAVYGSLQVGGFR